MQIRNSINFKVESWKQLKIPSILLANGAFVMISETTNICWDTPASFDMATTIRKVNFLEQFRLHNLKNYFPISINENIRFIWRLSTIISWNLNKRFWIKFLNCSQIFLRIEQQKGLFDKQLHHKIAAESLEGVICANVLNKFIFETEICLRKYFLFSKGKFDERTFGVENGEFFRKVNTTKFMEIYK